MKLLYFWAPSLVLCASISHAAQTLFLPEMIFKDTLVKRDSHSNIEKSHSWIITQKDIHSSGAQSVAQILSQSASVQTYDNTGANPLFYLRGQRATILINGQPMNQFDSSAQNLSAIPLSSIQKIIVSNQSSSVLYGSMGIGGSINIITKNTHSHVSITPTYPGLGRIDLNGHQKLSNDWQLNFSQSVQNQMGYRPFNRRISSATGLTLGHAYQDGKINFSLNYGVQDLQFPGGLDEAQFHANPWQASDGRENYHTQTLQLSSHWQQKLSTTLEFDNQLFYQKLWAHGDFPESTFLTPFTQGYQKISTRPVLSIHTHLWELPFDSEIGVSAAHENFYQSSIISSAYQNSLATFLTGKISLSSHWVIGSGGRLTYISTHGDIIQNPTTRTIVSGQDHYTPYAANVFLTRKWTNQYSSTVNIARAYQLPFIDQSSLTGAATSTFGLKPETSISYNLINNYHTQKLSAQLNFYLLNTENQIYYNPTTSVNQNLDPTRQIGLIISSEYQLLQHIQIGGSLHAMHNTFRSGQYNGNTVPGQPYLQAELHSVVHFSTHWHWYVQEQFNSAEYPDSDLNNAANKVSPYWLTNTTLSYHDQQWNVRLRINNLFNQHYNNFVSSYTNGTNVTTVYYPADGINGALTFGYTFS